MLVKGIPVHLVFNFPFWPRKLEIRNGMLAPDRMFFGLVVFSFVRRIDLGSVRTVNSELNCVSITE